MPRQAWVVKAVCLTASIAAVVPSAEAADPPSAERTAQKIQQAIGSGAAHRDERMLFRT